MAPTNNHFLRSAKAALPRVASAVIVLACFVWMTPLRSGLAALAQAMYTRLHVEGNFFAGLPESSETIFLVGDAGAMTDGVTKALERATRGTTTPPTLVYLGDNIYPLGIPASTSTPEWRLARARLMKQIDPFRPLTRQIFFTSGNHDWENHSPDGWNAMKRETAIIDAELGAGHLLPARGCPGPTRTQLFPDLQMIALDSSWWLHEYSKPSRIDDGCEVFSENEIVRALDEMLKNTPPGVETLVILHHPLLATLADHAHSKCPFSPDCPAYTSMREKIGVVLAKHRPFLCASGHNHALQIHREQSGCRTYVVSGGGSTVYPAKQPKSAEFAVASLGFMAVHRDARSNWRLDVIGVRADDSALPIGSKVLYSTTAKTSDTTTN